MFWKIENRSGANNIYELLKRSELVVFQLKFVMGTLLEELVKGVIYH